MKIKVKETKVVEKDFKVPANNFDCDEHFQDLLDYLGTLEFVASSSWDNFKSFLSYKQGGSNGADITEITILEEFGNTLVVKATWGSCNIFSHIIFRLP